jgi:mannose-6-phosphate isomerase-like protein (cupin superfamily)
MVKTISHEGNVLAIIIRASFSSEGIHFFTPQDFSQQLGYMNRPKGYKIPPHSHNEVKREVLLTNEVLFIKSGKVRVDFYQKNEKYLESELLMPGDVILLASESHGFEMLEPSEMIEVKQGPYAGEDDKTIHANLSPDKIIINND